MDDEPTYLNFITNTCVVAVPRLRNELLSYANAFSSLLATTEKEFDTFVKTTHASNSARPANAKILIPNAAIIAVKAVLFELKDREHCNALPNQAMLNAIDPGEI